MTTVDWCLLPECSLKTYTLVCLIVYLIISIQRFINGLEKFGEYKFGISFVLEARHVLWSIFLVLGIEGLVVYNDASHLVFCLGIHVIDLIEMIIDYIGFIFTKTIIIPSFGHSNKRYDHKYIQGLIVFPCLIFVFACSCAVVYSYYHNELNGLRLEDFRPSSSVSVIDEDFAYANRIEYSLMF